MSSKIKQFEENSIHTGQDKIDDQLDQDGLNKT
jgi:hypothetical protein